MSGNDRCSVRGGPVTLMRGGVGARSANPSSVKRSNTNGTLREKKLRRSWIPKCRCGPWVFPLFPSRPISCPARMRWPGRTRTEPVFRWP